jgi:membrane protein implicated in regulation of membrane protease activity
MEDWVYWMIAAAALAAGEIFTMGFFLGPIAVAAVLSAVVALAGGGLALQLVVFTVAALASVLVLRPIARRHLRTPARLRSGAAALVGTQALVLERVDANGGSVKLRGEVWTARAFDDDDVFEPGVRVDVMEIDGATALVAE